MKTEKEKSLRKFVYMGQCERGYEYGLIGLEDSQKVQRPWLLSKKICKSIIGSVFEFELCEGMITYKSNQRAISYWEDSKQVAEWRLRERMYNYAKKEKEEVQGKNVENELKWLRNIYNSSSFSERTILLAEIIRIITK